MSDRFDLTLLDGRASLRNIDTGTGIALAGREQFPYQNAQQATELCIDAIGALTGRMRGDRADDVAVAHALTNGAASLAIRGHARECRVVALHLHVRYGLDFADMTSPTPVGGVRVKPVRDAVDGLSTYRFDSEMRHVEALRRLVDRWLAESDRDAEAKAHAERNVTMWRKLLSIGAKEQAPVRVVVTGVTGAGKSTFLNAILGRDVLPSSSGICTAALLRLRKASVRSAEGFEVEWRSAEDVDRQIIELTTELQNSRGVQGAEKVAAELGYASETLTSRAERARILPSKIDAMRAARRQLAEKARRLPLRELAKYARNAPDSCAEAVHSINVFVDHPLLLHVELVDAPGLRDGDHERQRLLIKAFEGDVGWLYLAPAASRDDTCKADWAHIQQLAHNSAGVLLLTKADGINPDRGRTLAEAMTSRVLEYRRYGWERAVEWCAALLPAELASLRGADENVLVQAFDIARPNVLLALPGREPCRRLQEFMVEQRNSPSNWATFVDYSLDASRLPMALRRAGQVLYEDVIVRRVDEGRSALVQAVQEAIAQVEAGRARAEQTLEAHDTMSELGRQLAELRSELTHLTAQLADRRAAHGKILTSVDESEDESRKAFKAASERHAKTLSSSFKRSFDQQSKPIMLSGPRSFPFVAELEAPLGDVAHGFLAAHAAAIVEAIAACRGERGLELGGLLKNYVLLEVHSVGDVHDQEKVLEWKSTTEARMREEIERRAQRCVERMGEAFAARLKQMRIRTTEHLLESEAACRGAIKSRGEGIAKLEAAILCANPAQSREHAEASLSQLAEHGAVFRGFLAEVMVSQVSR